MSRLHPGLIAPRNAEPGLIARHLAAPGLTVLATLAAFAAVGCGPAAHGAGAALDQRAHLGRDPLEIVDTASGERISWDELAAALDDARVVYVGERHDAAIDHEVQRAVIDAVHERDASLSIGMEMFQHPFQAPLDAWVAGTIDEAELLRASEWEERWNVDFALYRPILELARTAHIPIVALNARRELTRAIARDGEDALPPELRAELPAIDRDDPEHRAMIMAAFGEHPDMDPARLERFYLAQLVWDESMAEAVARTLEAPGAPRRMVVLAGRMHVQRGVGIPRRAARRGAEPFRVILPLTAGELEDARSLCDYAVVIPE